MALLDKLRDLYNKYDECIRFPNKRPIRFALDRDTREVLEQAISVFERLQPHDRSHG